MARRGIGGVLGQVNTSSKQSASGIWTLNDQMDAARREAWSNMLPTWDVSPIGSFDTYTNSGSIAQSSNTIYLTSAGYNGGIRGWAVADGSPKKALQNNWYLDFIHNRNGVNSSPYPNYSINITRSNSASDFYNTNENSKRLTKSEVGNAYGFDFSYYDGLNSGSILYSINQNGGTYAYAGVAVRLAFDATTFKITRYGNTSGSFSGMTELDSYTPTSGEKSALEAFIDSDWYVGLRLRSNSDGFRNIRWYTV